MDIHAIYSEAGILHGHLCPGLAIGVRAAVEAKLSLRASPENISCTVEKQACWTDGLRSVLGATPENGRLEVLQKDAPVFHFRDVNNGNTLTLSLKAAPQGQDKQAHIEYVLTAKAGDIFCFEETTRLP